jgi:hypothetical protein
LLRSLRGFPVGFAGFAVQQGILGVSSYNQS